MPFIAVCPYCQAGRVRAPESALGLTAACPRCHSCFTLIDSGESLEEAQARSGPLGRPAAAAAATAAVPTGRRAAQAGPTTVRPDARTELNERTTLEANRVALPAPAVVPFAETTSAPDPVRLSTLIAFTLAGLGLLAAQFPFGRYGTVGAAGLGLLLALVCWVAATRPLLPALATGLNTVVVLVALLLPGWLGLGPWRPNAVEQEDARTVRSFGADGLAAPANEWVPVPDAWQLGDVRVKVAAMWVGPVELTGTDGKTRWSRKRYLQLKVRVGNVGVARQIDFAGWDPNPRKGEPGVRLTDATGRSVPAGTVDSGWTVPAARPKPARLAPAHAAEQLLLFEPLARPTDYLRLELPGSAFGADLPVRFQIATSWMSTGPPK